MKIPTLTSKQKIIAAFLIVGVLVIIAFIALAFSRQDLDERPQSAFPDNPDAIILTEDNVGIQDDVEVSDSSRVLEQISDSPVAGYSVYPDAEEPYVLYVNQNDGFMYKHIVGEDKTSKETLSSTTIPRVLDAVPNLDGLSFYKVETLTPPHQIRYQLYSLGDDGLEFSRSLINITDVERSGDSLVVIEAARDGSDIYEILPDGSERFITNVPFRDIHIAETSPSSIYVATKPSFASDSILWEITKSSGRTEISATAENGGSFSLGNNGSDILISEKRSNKWSTRYQSNGESFAWSNAALADKCTYNSFYQSFICGIPDTLERSHDLPDAWYRGEQELDGAVAQFDIDSRNTFFLPTTTAEIDINYPQSIGERFIFQDQTDRQLYNLDITEAFLSISD